MKKVLIAILFLIFSGQNCFAQDRLNNSNSLNDFSFGNWYSGTKNFIEVSYGFSELKNKDLITSIKSNTLTEIKLGKRYLKPAGNYRILQFEDNYLFSSYVNDNLNDLDRQTNISFEIWRFGLGFRKGYGYSFGNIAILPSYQMGLVWNQSNFRTPNLDYFLQNVGNPFPQNDISLIKNYDNAIKFGTNNIAGIDFKIGSTFNIGGGYETQIILPQYLVWKHLGSILIETLSQTGIDFLIEGVIIKASPTLTPIVYFLLKNGLSYFFYTLKQEDMNWPFNSKAPLTLEAVKIDLKITF
ncbi:MAG: hypothetical protein H6611_08095 [Ignavibacteriales bacterium]|nr:hypothetical protein [Ignavibacteriales bacterium]